MNALYEHFEPETIGYVRNVMCEGNVSDEDLYRFFHLVHKTGLDPLSNQIYLIRRGGRYQTQTGIDGFRLAAERTGVYGGSSDVTFDAGRSHHEMGTERPATASVTVYKILGGIMAQTVATASWAEYCPKPPSDKMWKKMPLLMLGKVAESLALRKAFPAELSGLYTEDEMAQADREPGPGADALFDAPLSVADPTAPEDPS